MIALPLVIALSVWAVIFFSGMTLVIWLLAKRRHRHLEQMVSPIPLSNPPMEPPQAVRRGLSRVEIDGAAPAEVFASGQRQEERVDNVVHPENCTRDVFEEDDISGLTLGSEISTIWGEGEFVGDRGCDGDGEGIGNAGSDCEVTCAVCLETINPGERVRRIVRCSHTFHSSCIRKWLRRQNRCPLCTRAVVERDETRSEGRVAMERSESNVMQMVSQERGPNEYVGEVRESLEEVAMRRSSVLSAPVQERNRSVSLTSFATLAQPKLKERVVSWLHKLTRRRNIPSEGLEGA